MTNINAKNIDLPYVSTLLVKIDNTTQNYNNLPHKKDALPRTPLCHQPQIN